ncbi:hypothetical protein HYFRA_00001679 [Hymenoscyphus fraxineus]|uniref:Uncharacterized protein n=1 Tax=Hymenoscyphus fraxineus TaxID=746836 RepID=A0A9N9LA62_9HELO|nr:hypothetical protein HYFRA_00001679 [Hymenoscyphus fraxineus]
METNLEALRMEQSAESLFKLLRAALGYSFFLRQLYISRSAASCGIRQIRRAMFCQDKGHNLRSGQRRIEHVSEQPLDTPFGTDTTFQPSANAMLSTQNLRTKERQTHQHRDELGSYG